MAEIIFNYILKNFDKAYQVKSSEYDISYGINNRSRIQILKCDEEYFKGKTPWDHNKIAWKNWNNERIPLLFTDGDDKNILDIEECRIIINYDIIASGFYSLSNWQEYVSQKKDAYGRFIFTDSIQYKLNITDIPVVNYYFDILKSAIEAGYRIKLNPDLWGGRDLAVCVTHDVDLCESARLQGSYREIRKGHLMEPFKLIARKVFSNDAWYNFREIIDTEKKYRINSTFFFLAEERPKDGIPNADYKITIQKFTGIFELIEENGSEIALHGSIGTHLDTEMFRSEIHKIRREIIGNRFHFLLYNSFHTPEILAESGLKYDSSLCFAETSGFRNSYCLPFYLFDLKNFCSTEVVEIPLIVMDTTFDKRYMGLDKEDALAKMFCLVDKTEKFKGCFTFLWHNTSFSEYKYTGWRDVYCRFLQSVTSRKALVTSGRNILRCFNNQI